jgi:hypothetical protein
MVQTTEAFAPTLLKGLKFYPDDPFKFDFIVDMGDKSSPERASSKAFQQESEDLVKYFLAVLTIPEKDLWVNLSPYEKDRIIPEELSRTPLGRDLLSQDYILKQITSSLLYPEGETGKKFWANIYSKAYELYGTTDVPVDTFNKVWIIPQSAEVYVENNAVVVTSAHLKVMLENDYLAMSENRGHDEETAVSVKTADNLSETMIRDLIIPELEKEVNTGSNFARLRQIFYSMILATWYKSNLKTSILNQSYADQGKTEGINTVDVREKQDIYDLYVQAFKKGVYNFIKDEYDENSQTTIPRKYFSGGFSAKNFVQRIIKSSTVAKLVFAGLAIMTFSLAAPQVAQAQQKWHKKPLSSEKSRIAFYQPQEKLNFMPELAVGFGPVITQLGEEKKVKNTDVQANMNLLPSGSLGLMWKVPFMHLTPKMHAALVANTGVFAAQQVKMNEQKDRFQTLQWKQSLYGAGGSVGIGLMSDNKNLGYVAVGRYYTVNNFEGSVALVNTPSVAFNKDYNNWISSVKVSGTGGGWGVEMELLQMNDRDILEFFNRTQTVHVRLVLIREFPFKSKKEACDAYGTYNKRKYQKNRDKKYRDYSEEKIKESPMIPNTSRKTREGGINLNAENMIFKATGDATDFVMPSSVDKAAFDQIKGLVPVFIRMTPISGMDGLMAYIKALP